jgi:hypothetical protein
MIYQPDSADDMLLLSVDIQERLFPSMGDKAQRRILEGVELLGLLSSIFKIPVLITEQYPKGLGPTLPAVEEHLPGATVLEKTTFDCMKDQGIRDHISSSGKKTVLLAGMETHVCVYQTAVSLVNDGYRVVPVTDVLSSRQDMHWQWALESLAAQGCYPMPAETLAFYLLERSGTPEFKRVSALLKSRN